MTDFVELANLDATAQAALVRTGKTSPQHSIATLSSTRSADIESMDEAILREYAAACGWALARAHARSGDAAMIAGYMGSGRTFDEAICDFAVDYADQAERDHQAFVKAVRVGRVTALVES